MNIHNNERFSERCHLSDKQFRNEKRYNIGMKMNATLLDKGIISEHDFVEISKKLAKKYTPIYG